MYAYDHALFLFLESLNRTDSTLERVALVTPDVSARTPSRAHQRAQPAALHAAHTADARRRAAPPVRAAGRGAPAAEAVRRPRGPGGADQLAGRAHLLEGPVHQGASPATNTSPPHCTPFSARDRAGGRATGAAAAPAIARRRGRFAPREQRGPGSAALGAPTIAAATRAAASLAQVLIWQLTEYARVLYYDSDVVFIKAPDGAIDACGEAELCAAQDTGLHYRFFNAGFLVLRPSTERLDEFKARAPAASSARERRSSASGCTAMGSAADTRCTADARSAAGAAGAPEVEHRHVRPGAAPPSRLASTCVHESALREPACFVHTGGRIF